MVTHTHTQLYYKIGANKTPRQSFVIEILIRKVCTDGGEWVFLFPPKDEEDLHAISGVYRSVTVLHDPVVSCRRARCPSHGKKKKRKTWRGVWTLEQGSFFSFVPLTKKKKERIPSWKRQTTVLCADDSGCCCNSTSLSLSQVGGPTRPTLHPHTPVCDYSSSALSLPHSSPAAAAIIWCGVTLKTCTTSHHTNRALSTDNNRTNVDRRC
mmetsp:Transcript_22213/g.25555  ORF Transcript_22213/g.25555 Transcript_22213/m.25555 type:complete len:210 (-) Transcript_22213:142-771(-)